MIQILEDMITRFSAYSLEFKDSDGFTNKWGTLIPALELAYKTPVHSSTGQNPSILYKGWNLRLPKDTLRRKLIEINSEASSFKLFLDKVKHNAKLSMDGAFKYSKHIWEKSHEVPDFKVGDLVLVSTLNFNNIKVKKKLKNSYAGPFVIVALHGNNDFQVKLNGKLENKNPMFPVSLLKAYQPADKDLFTLRNPTPLAVLLVKQNGDKKDNEIH
ncbi:hypothetical protein O181_041190 [Austropuccinia psidii MF-1]|uniref:Tf2-1-like SH3-like domain-containing protein n=1 Tax=Austropuccinia psidii MF-1 TaxID=1389203 RepID=A0A9Q3HGX1_9BASI|nr:hypothetical protein [Austropuccinia psidii MF-1]